MRKVVIVTLMLVSACTSDRDHLKAFSGGPELLHLSVKRITDLLIQESFSPPVSSRIYCYVNVAAYEAAIAGDSQYSSLAGQLNGLKPLPKPQQGKDYSFEIASIHALLKVGKSLMLTEGRIDVFYDSVMALYRDYRISDDVYERSIGFGWEIVHHILTWAAKDNYIQSRSFPIYFLERKPGTWKGTPPSFQNAMEPYWSKIRTFAINSSRQFRPESPATFSDDTTSQWHHNALEVYNVSKNLTEEQKTIAYFWDCNPQFNVRGQISASEKKMSSGGHWISITGFACKKAKLGFVLTCEAYVRVCIVIADAFISCWEEKFRSKSMMPETYINQYIDSAWRPLLQSPPFPEYTSSLSVISRASSVVLTDLFGEKFSIIDSIGIQSGLDPRIFKSFEEAAREAGESRIYGGVHYRPAIKNGAAQGERIGEFLLKNIVTSSGQPIAKRELSMQKHWYTRYLLLVNY